ncbi:MAG: hypothetical protein BWK80_35210 [Desulfobacteraceae bacterium IS3]|nr:MAG: hypothetical protein BWK80_35210 [Desulfobacteraceae bacterium IS3]
MSKKKGKSVSFDAMIKFFMQNYEIPSKKDIEKVIERMERLEQLILSAGGGTSNKKASAKVAAKGKTPVAKSPLNASDTVLEVIKNAKEGMDFAKIQAKTGFDDKKLRNIIFRLNKTGRIQRRERGIYVIS